MPSVLRKLAVVMIGLCLCLATVGCPGPVTRDPQTTALDSESGINRRAHAVEQLFITGDSAEARDNRKVLHRLVWSDDHPLELRQTAMAQLIAVDAETFGDITGFRLHEIDDWPMLRHVLQTVEQYHWQQAAGAVVRSWARPSKLVPDDQRPERETLESLFPDRSAIETLSAALLDDGSSFGPSQRAAAWQVLSRVTEIDERDRILWQGNANSALVVDLRVASQCVDVLPSDTQGLLRLATLRSEQNQSLWNAFENKAKQLTAEQQQGLSVRHLAVVLAMQDHHAELSKDQLRSRVAQRLSGRQFYSRSPEVDYVPIPNQRWSDHVDSLSWADMLAIDLILDAMENQAVKAQWFEQAWEDVKDTTTEYGGLLVGKPHAFQAKAYPPERVGNDRQYQMSLDMLRDSYTSLAHYHFHAPREENARFAGPGPADLKMVNTHGPIALVLTLIDQSHMNVDFYTQGNIIIDLGTISYR